MRNLAVCLAVLVLMFLVHLKHVSAGGSWWRGTGLERVGQ